MMQMVGKAADSNSRIRAQATFDFRNCVHLT